MQHPLVNMKLSVTFLREGKRFIAHAPALDLSTSGKSLEEAKSRFEEIVQIFIEEITKRKTIQEVLENLGWQKEHNQWIPPVVVGHESHQIKIPTAV